jgi:hypothetical protein
MTGPDGALEFAGLAAGKYRLEIWGPSGSRKSLDPLVVSASRSLELGDIALVPGSNLEGSVIVPYEIDPSTIKLRCWSMARDSSAQVKADHSFRFEGLAAGTAHVTVEEAFGLVRWGTLARVQLEPGQTQRVTLDLNDRVSVAAKLHVLVNGKPARGVRVFLKTGSGEGRERMNETDASGTSTGNVRALGPVDVTLLAPSGMNLGRFEGKLDLAVGSRPEATIEVSCAALEVEWPPLPADERLYSVVIDANPDSEEEGLTAHTMPHAEPPSTDAYVVGERRARFDWMPSGDLEWTIDVQTFDGRGARAYHKFRRQIRLAATGTTLVELTEADRVQER